MLHTLAFQRLTFNDPEGALELLRHYGSAEQVYLHRQQVAEDMPLLHEAIKQAVISGDWDGTLRWAEEEMKWCEQKGVSILPYGSPDYPKRLEGINDAPIALFCSGNANLNATHAVSFVGTRQSTSYGNDVCNQIVKDMKRMFPDMLIISGLAYGIDVAAHRGALANGLSTVGVVAHGLDTIYPAAHRQTAAEMVRGNGAILSEYASHTRIDRYQFLRRNRIVAAMADCTVVVESKSHGGSLVTAGLADGYGRQVFAVPGRVSDEASKGCNQLISQQKALMATSADDIAVVMGWNYEQTYREALRDGIQTSLFMQLTDDEKAIADVLSKGDMQLNDIVVSTGKNVSEVSALLFQMEMSGLITPLAGGVFHLVEQY